MKSVLRYTGIASLLTLALAAGIIIHIDAERKTSVAWRHHLVQAQARSKQDALRVAKTFGSLYENLRTLSTLPSVRKIDRHGLTLGEDGKETIQQVYNNLATNIDVSKLNIIPVSFKHNRIDPVTGQLEQPILTLDEVIVRSRQIPQSAIASAQTVENGAVPRFGEEDARFESAQLEEQLAWFGWNFPDRKAINGLNLPMLGGAEVITSDNSQYQYTHNDADRKGLIFSVPFYGADDRLKGSISAIILSDALQRMLPSRSYALMAPRNSFATATGTNGIAGTVAEAMRASPISADATYIETINLPTHDPRGAWTLRVEHMAAKFFDGSEYRAIRTFEAMGLAVLGLVTIAGLGWLYVMRQWSSKMLHNATHDALTGLANKVRMMTKIKEMLKRGGAPGSSAVLYLDLDRFKSVNDTLGHHVGDLLLKAVAERMANCLRKTDLLARIGGDEFVVLQNELQKAGDASFLAQRIINRIAEPFDIEGHQIVIGTSAGISMAFTDGNDADTLLRNADLALFRAKANERGTWRYFEPNMDAALRKRRRLEMDLRQALSRNQLVLHYQPIVDAVTQTITGFEALMRWNHPEFGMIPPLEFISIAEDIGEIVPIGEWAIRQACFDAVSWPAPTKIAVNLSAVQFRTETLPWIVESALDESGLDASRLELEITESVLLTTNDNSIKILRLLRELGVSIVLDDFGTGYASLSYLRAFTFDKIKIDRSFVQDVMGGGKDIAIVKAIASLGLSLEMTTTAEGIETEEQFQKIREQGYTHVQGYLFGRPGPVANTGAMFPKALPKLKLVG
jgi:diguanylate cyclase (GGDEF)-like protein